MSQGPKVFITRLLDRSSLDFKVFNPSLNDFRRFKKSKDQMKIVLRLDGVTYYRFNNISFSNYLLLLGYNKIVIKLVLFFFPRRDFRILNYALNYYLNRISYFFLKSGHKIVFQSSLSLEMHKFLFPRLDWINVDYCIIHNGIDVQKFRSAEPLNLQGYPKLLISASKFRMNKRLFEAINLINVLKNEYSNIHLHVLGDLDNLVSEQISNLDLSNTTFHGLVKVEDLSKFYLACDLQLSLSIFDPCPNVVVEGLACGLPVVTPKQSGAFELIGSNTDWTVDERLAFDFYYLHDKFNCISFDYDAYSLVVKNILINLNYHKLNASARAMELDIEIVAQKYYTLNINAKN